MRLHPYRIGPPSLLLLVGLALAGSGCGGAPGGSTAAATSTTPAPDPASVSPGSTVATAAGATALGAGVAMRAFRCAGSLGRAYTREAVAGLLDAADAPLGVTLTQTTTGLVLVTEPTPVPAPAYGAYWQAQYQLDAWALGTTARGSYHLLLPGPPLGSFFQALAITDFASGGSWQVWMLCTAG